jgi:signal transduction histidine kinase
MSRSKARSTQNLRSRASARRPRKTAPLAAARNAFEERDAERESIARELHDKIGQYLVVVEMELSRLLDDAALSDELRQRVAQLKKLTNEAREDVGQLAWEIRPAPLRGGNLHDACKLLLDEWAERSRLTFDTHLSFGSLRLPEAIENTIYRVLQEALTNVVKHAKAKRVGVMLQASPQEVRLVVEDDGEGFVGGKKPVGATVRLGLLGIRERLSLVNGNLEIESAQGKGTTLLISVPL